MRRWRSEKGVLRGTENLRELPVRFAARHGCGATHNVSSHASLPDFNPVPPLDSYDKAGYGANITLNTGHIFSQQASTTPYTTVDGEGILQQPGQNSAGLYDAFVGNDLSGSGSGASIWYFDLLNAQHGVFLNNKAGNPASAFIGVLMIRSGDTGSEFTASGNTPAAQYCYPPPAPHKPSQCSPIPPPLAGAT